MNEVQILVLPKPSGLSASDKSVLRKAGIVVVEVNSPHQARLLIGERLPIDSNEMLRSVMTVVAANKGDSYSRDMRLQIMDGIAKAIVASNTAMPTAT